MSPTTLALRFTAALWLPSHATPEQTLVVLPDRERLRVDVYRPRDRPPTATLVVLHGMTPRANTDPRIVRLARALRLAGFCAVVPELPDVRDLAFTQRTLRRLIELVHVLQRDAEPREPLPRVGLVGASYLGGLALRAAAHPELRGRLSGVLAIGPHGDAVTLFRRLLTDPASDDYARRIVQREVLLRRQRSPDLAAVLHDAILDEALDRHPPEAPRTAATIRGGLPRFEAVEGVAARTRLLRDLTPSDLADLADLSPLPVADQVDCPVLLFHGPWDTVVPPSESLALFQALHAAGVPVQRRVTGLLDHGTLGGDPLTLAREIPAAVRDLSTWFERLLAPRRTALLPAATAFPEPLRQGG